MGGGEKVEVGGEGWGCVWWWQVMWGEQDRDDQEILSLVS